MKLKILLCAASAVVLAAGGAATMAQDKRDDPSPERRSAPEGVSLRPHFALGQEAHFTIKSEATTSMSAGADSDLAGDTRTNQEIGLGLRIIEVTDSGTTAEIVLDRIIMTIDGPAGKDSFDSTRQDKNNRPGKEPDSELTKALAPVVGQAMTVRFDAQGNVTEVGGLEKLAPAGPMGEIVRSMLVSADGKGGVASVVGLAGAPEYVKRGDQWTNTDTLALPIGPMSLTTEHRVTGATGDRVTIRMDGKLEAAAGGAGGLADAIGLKIKSSKIDGEYVWDAEEGMVQSVRSEQAITIEAGGADAAVTITQTSRTDIKKDRSRAPKPLRKRPASDRPAE